MRADDRGQNRREVRGIHLVGDVGGNRLKPQCFCRNEAAVTLAEGVGLVGGDECHGLDALFLHQVLVDGRAGLVVGDHSKYRIGCGSRVQRLGKGVREIDDSVRLGYRPDSGRAIVHVRPDHIVDSFLGHLFHSGDCPFRVLLVVERDDFDVIGDIPDLVSAGFVDPRRAGFHRTLVRNAPCGGRPAGDADEADLEHGIVGKGGCSRNRRQGERRGQGRE